MRKTGSEIEIDIYLLVKNSRIASTINGKVYRNGERPQNSTKEDAVVVFITTVGRQTQIGKVNVNIYIPDKNNNGYTKKDSKRCREIERVCQDFVDNLKNGNYIFSTEYAVQTFDEPKISQHFVNVQLEFQYNTLIN